MLYRRVIVMKLCDQEHGEAVSLFYEGDAAYFASRSNNLILSYLIGLHKFCFLWFTARCGDCTLFI